MKTKIIVLVAEDAAPSGAFERLKPVLEKHGFAVAIHVGKGKDFPIATEDLALGITRGVDFLLLGMSSSAKLAELEIVAGRLAQEAKIPFGFYGDIPGCWRRARPGAWFENLAPSAALYFGITEEDAEEAREVFSAASLVGAGNPLREEMAFPRYSRETVRGMLGAEPDEKIILAPGNKCAGYNLPSLVMIMEVLAGMGKFRLIFSRHPGDRTDPNHYYELCDWSPVPAEVIDRERLTTSELVPGADLIIEFGSSIGIEGAYQQVPVITLGFEAMFRRLERINGTRQLESVRDGLSELVRPDLSEMRAAISRLLTPKGFAIMRERQQKLCPPPLRRGEALERMADALVRLLG